jgi:hypothetical protein
MVLGRGLVEAAWGGGSAFGAILAWDVEESRSGESPFRAPLKIPLLLRELKPAVDTDTLIHQELR